MLARDDAVALSAASMERAIGDNVAHWQPRGADDAALAWRRCINEIQMAWFDHPVNAARAAAGKATINTLWAVRQRHAAQRAAALRRDRLRHPVARGIAVAPDAPRVLESFDGFIGPARHEDWSGWREQLGLLDARLTAHHARQAQGTIDGITLMLCGDASTKIVTLNRGDTRKFWRGWSKQPSLALFAEGSEA